MDFFGMNIVRSNRSEFYSEEDMLADWYKVQKFLYNFSEIMPSHRERAELEINGQLRCRHSLTVHQLSSEFIAVNWTRLLRETVAPDIRDDDEVCLPFPQYMQDLDLMLMTFSPRIVHNAVLLMYRKSHLDYLVDALSGAAKSDQARDQYCLGLVETVFPVPLAGMFVRDAGRARVDAFKVKEPSHHRLLRLMKTLTSIGDTFSDQYLAADFQAEDTIWSYVVQPYSPNAYYLTDRNAVVIPLAFLSEPYLFDDVPRYITMAALGTTIAHELLHSVGVTGFYFNSAGELHSLSEATEHQLSDLRHCVRHQFTRNLSREVEISGLLFSAQPNGELTLDENLSDHDGLALAWRTYHRWQHRHRHSPEPRLPGVQGSVRQTFLLALAQVS
ncbi:Endothelin-converting enzyme-like 1 [Amphibalanus amphitrite]|uniref:Endothelin-converting enzyme-like 1 n=1 Tax=Amphibalanus amphitrite TaxID=1232801 RepID=A0A6A4X9P7_AMPAM|nr:Endothelin-converting enzyme-like 1 [Amphibalanus amphitrite]